MWIVHFDYFLDQTPSLNRSHLGLIESNRVMVRCGADKVGALAATGNTESVTRALLGADLSYSVRRRVESAESV